MRFLSVLLLLIPLISYADDEFFNCQPVDNGSALINPGMGWNFAYYSNSTVLFNSCDPNPGIKNGDDVLDYYPGCSIVFFRLSWDQFNDPEDCINWSKVEGVVQKWGEKGKKVAFCWNVADKSWQATPIWVREAGAKGHWVKENTESPADTVSDNAIPIDRNAENAWIFKGPDPSKNNFPQYFTNGNPRFFWIPNYDDPVFLNKFEKFIKSAALKWDNDPRVEFFEIGSIGTWGEGHNFFIWGKLTDSMRLYHIGLWRKYFKKTTVFVNDDFISNLHCKPNSPTNDTQLIINTAITNRCGMADHSINVDGDGGHPRPPERAGMAASFWPTLPILLEDHPGKGYIPNDYYTAMLNYHASYMRIHDCPLTLLSASKDLIDKINLRLGYRFQIAEAGWTKSAQAGKQFTVILKIRNGGVAPCYRGGKVSVYLKINDADSLPYLSITDTTFNVKNLMPSFDPNLAPIKQLSFLFTIPSNCPSSKLSVYVSVLDSVNKPYLLPYPNDDGKHRYKLSSSPSNDFIYKYLLPIIPGL